MKRILFVLLCFVVLSIGCPGKHPSDIMAPVIMKSSSLYHFGNQSLIGLYDSCKLLGDRCPSYLKPIVTNWNAIDDKCDLLDDAFTEAENLWLEVSRLKTPESIEQFNAQWSIVSRLLDELFALVPGLKTAKVITPFGVIQLQEITPEVAFGGNHVKAR